MQLKSLKNQVQEVRAAQRTAARLSQDEHESIRALVTDFQSQIRAIRGVLGEAGFLTEGSFGHFTFDMKVKDLQYDKQRFTISLTKDEAFALVLSVNDTELSRSHEVTLGTIFKYVELGLNQLKNGK